MRVQAARERRIEDAYIAPKRSEICSFVARSLTALCGRQGVAQIVVPAPIARPESLLARFESEASLLWRPPNGSSFAGVGVACEVAPQKDAVVEFFGNVHRVLHASVAGNRPRLFGGMAFDSSANVSPPWESFGKGALILPRWLYQRSYEHDGNEASAWLSLTVDGASLDAEDLDSLLREFEVGWSCLVEDVLPTFSAQTPKHIEHVAREGWNERVGEIRKAIQSGQSKKIVAARHAIVDLEENARPLGIVTRLRDRFPGCTSFCFWRKDAAFLGASPELLVRVRGREVASEAMAGSVALGGAAALLSNAKERDEHQLVVDAIVESLSDHCDEVQVSDEPTIRELPNVLHMQTPIHGRLRSDLHVLELVDSLHPTPAVGGVPSNEAIRWITANEGARGWYSAPFGWVDDDGDGEFVVALRTGLAIGKQVWVYAGAGIMGDSDADAEFAETEMKMQALLGALDPTH